MSEPGTPQMPNDQEKLLADFLRDFREKQEKIEGPKVYLSEGRESWRETIADYWAHYEENEKAESQASDHQERERMDELMKQFSKGIAETHHRLASSIGALRNAFHGDNFFTSDQIEVLSSISSSATREGKIERYKSQNEGSGIHPVNKVFQHTLETSEISDEDFVIYQKDAYNAGVSMATATSLEDIYSWFVWADGKGYIEKGNKLPILFLVMIKGDLRINFESTKEVKDELSILDDATIITDYMQQGEIVVSREVLEAVGYKVMLPAYKKWVEKYLPTEISPDFQYYLNIQK